MTDNNGGLCEGRVRPSLPAQGDGRKGEWRWLKGGDGSCWRSRPMAGARRRPTTRTLPLTADELARTAAECLERGASMIHLHVRDAEGRHCLDPEAYRATIAQICEAVGDRLVLQITSELLGRYSPAEQRAAVLKTNPEAVSLALRELAPEAPDERDFCLFLSKLKQMRDLAADHSLHARRGGAAGRDGEAGADPVRQALRPLCARALRAHPHRPAARPPAVPRPRHAAVRTRGASAPSAAARPPASPPPRCSAATRGSASRTISACPTAPAPRRTPNWSARRRRARSGRACASNRGRPEGGDRGGDGRMSDRALSDWTGILHRADWSKRQ